MAVAAGTDTRRSIDRPLATPATGRGLPAAATIQRLARGRKPPHIFIMLTPEGAALIAEVIAAAWLIVALAGFCIRRTTPWLVCSVVAVAMLLTSVAVIIGST
jgi:hypothetical protein